MKKQFLFILFILFSFNGYSQNQTDAMKHTKKELIAPRKIAVIGTSIEYGIGAPLNGSWPYLFSQLIGPNYLVDNYGVPGGTYTNTGVPIKNTVHREQIEGHDILIIGGPTNDLNIYWATIADTCFSRFYQGWIDSARKWSPGITIYCNLAIKSLHGTLPSYRIKRYNDTVRVIAKRNGLTIWSFDQLPTSILSTDLVHPSAQGYQVMANLAYKEFTSEKKKIYPNDDTPSVEFRDKNMSDVDVIIPVYSGLNLIIKNNRKYLKKSIY